MIVPRLFGSLLVTLGLMTATPVVAEEGGTAPAKATPLLMRALPDIEGKEAVMLTIEYPPGGASSPHRHNANTFVYVLEGSIVMQVKGGKEVTLGPGETFYESPTDIHTVSRNASKIAPAKFLVFFIKNVGAPPLVPVD